MGLIENAQSQSAPQQAPAQPSPQQGGDKQMEAMMTQAFQLGKQIIYKKEVFDGLMKQMSDGQTQPAAGLAEAIVMVLEKINSAGKLPLNIVFGVGMLLMNDVAEALNRTGRFNFDQATFEKAVQMATQMFLQTQSGNYSPEELQEGMSQLQGMGQQQGQPQPGGM